jgi:hypothetical protein
MEKLLELELCWFLFQVSSNTATCAALVTPWGDFDEKIRLIPAVGV